MPSYASSMRNLAKARANGRPPRPWRISDESRLIRRYVFLWYTSRGTKPSVAPGLKNWASATPGSRSWFGNFRQTRAKCGAYSEHMVIPDTSNSFELRNTRGG